VPVECQVRRPAQPRFSSRDSFLVAGLASRALADSLDSGSFKHWGMDSLYVLFCSDSTSSIEPILPSGTAIILLLWSRSKWRIFNILTCQGLRLWAVHSSVTSSTI